MIPTDDRTLSRLLVDHWTGAHLNVEHESKQYYKNQLTHGVWMLLFTKADGSISLMECTLDEKLLPPLSGRAAPRPEPEHLIHVYSLDRQGWRSFKVESVKSFYPKPESL